VPSEELTADFYQTAIAFLEQAGLQHYEISNFARSDRQSRHNLKYWRRQPYLGFGLDAHSMLRTPQGSALRFSNTAQLAEYLSGSDGPVEVHQLSPSEELEEAWFLGLRLREGVAWQALGSEFGRDQVEIFLPVVREVCDLGLVTDDSGVVRLTPRGVLFSNEVFARFLGVKEEFQTK
jgi:oxygen-independent coproporphyrinogen III oxidase